MKVAKFLSHIATLGTFRSVVAGRTQAQPLEHKYMDETRLWDALNPHNGTLLSPILIPRVPGTPGSAQVQSFIVDHFNRLGWHAYSDHFEAEGPHGPVDMANVIVKRSKGAKPAKLTLAAHHDSKIDPAGFVGAIDSAVPCALLLYVAEALASTDLGNDLDIDFIFFDGEEALVEWSDTDSLYGARFHAQNRPLPQKLVLLDLIGQPGAIYPSWFPETLDLFSEVETSNRHLLAKKLVSRQMFGGKVHEYAGMMLDDHIPFWHRGVPILHFIPPGFPDIWHTIDDDAAHLDWVSIRDWARILAFWLHAHFKNASEKEL